MLQEASMFLATSLKELNDLPDKHEAATVALATIAAVYESKVSETYLSLYLSQMDIEESVMKAAVSYFHGSQLLEVFCECSVDDFCNFPMSEFWVQRGSEDKLTEARQYRATQLWIDNLRLKLLDC